MTGLVLDDTVLQSLGLADATIVGAIGSLAASELRLSVPVAALIAAQAGLSQRQAQELNGMVDNNRTVRLHPLVTTADALGCATVLANLASAGDLSAAHTVMLARHLDWPIATADAKRWAEPATTLPWPLELIELRDEPEQQ